MCLLIYMCFLSISDYFLLVWCFNFLQMPKSLKLLLWTSLALLALQGCFGAKCGGERDAPSVKQAQIAFGSGGEGPMFQVEVQNNCPMCPIINLHLKCQGFPQSLVDPTLLRVLAGAGGGRGGGDCVVNDGLPLAPMEKISFNYSSDREFPLRPVSWFFQCE